MNNSCGQLQTLLAEKRSLIAPGVFDGLSAKLTEQAGFELCYASGGAMARSAGFPDIGILTQTEMLTQIEQIVSSVTIPVIADADTGFGNQINVRRAVKLYQQVGVAGLHIEDQEFPKRCGHLKGKTLISSDDMCRKVSAAKKAVTDENFLLIARTDAIAVEGFDAALARAQAYQEAGADMLFVEAPETIAQIEQIAAEVKGPKLINMFHGGKTPMVPRDKLQALGYQIVIIPSDLQRAAIFAIKQTLAAISADGDSQAVSDKLATFNEREAIIGTQDWLQE